MEKQRSETVRNEVQEVIDRMVDVFSGSDGGVIFMYFKSMIEKIDNNAQEEGNKDAEQVIDVLFKLNKMLEIAERLAANDAKNGADNYQGV